MMYMNKKVYKDSIIEMIIGKGKDKFGKPMISEDDIKLLAAQLTIEGPYYVLGFARKIYYANKVLSDNNGKNIPSLRLMPEEVETIADELMTRITSRLNTYSQDMIISVCKYGESSFGIRYEYPK